MERGVGKVRKALTLLMGNFDPLFFPLNPSPPRFWFRKGSTQGSYFKAISGLFPYPNGSCKKIGFHIELQIYVIGIGWFLLALPPKNRTCEFPRIRLKWLRNESFALGKRFAVAKLTASLSPRAKLRPRLLVASGRLLPSPEIQVSTGKDLLIPRGRLGSKLPFAYLTPFLIARPRSLTVWR
ncbi:hypothetical protein RIF29_45460 [Crotalaria pallida]|uniref:Uncharacterized protein n=1 Tax=Crotalaria pallida TaxID=3830 RepID=A0AAN9HPL3_CROPI